MGSCYPGLGSTELIGNGGFRVAFGGAFEDLVGAIEASRRTEYAMCAPVAWYPSGPCITGDEVNPQFLQCFEFAMLAFFEDVDDTVDGAVEMDYIQAKGQVTDEGSHRSKLISWEFVDACVEEFILRPKDLPAFGTIDTAGENDVHGALVLTMYLIVSMIILLIPKRRMARLIVGFELDDRTI